MEERRNINRKDFSYYLQLIDSETQELLGHLVNISSDGFKIDSQGPIETDKEYQIQMELTSEVADKPSITFYATCKWCKQDVLDPFVYNAGFHLNNISPEDMKIVESIMEKYGKEHKDKRIDKKQNSLW
ncbi:MAG: PilZ domain-containing protein [Anaerolineae bacterium]|nr:PilZ domain-containing protein [Anaerolineae bacterium]